MLNFIIGGKMKVTAVIAAGGKGTRMGADKNKVFLELCGKEIILHTIEAFEKNTNIDEIIVVTGSDDIETVKELKSKHNILKLKTIVEGGKTRQESVYNGLKAASGDVILVHDGARALVSDNEINEVIKNVKIHNAAAVGVMCKDTLKEITVDGFIKGTVDRSKTYQIQTPQGFMMDIILNAHIEAIKNGMDKTDDCALVEETGIRIKVCDGSYENIKITTPEDILIAEKILEKRKNV